MILNILDNIGELAYGGVLGRLRRVTALCVNRDLIIGVAFFGNTYSGEIFIVYNALDIDREHCAALVNNAVKVNTLSLKIFHYSRCTAVFRGNNLFVFAEKKIDVSFRLKPLFEKSFNGFDNGNKVVFHIKSASAPDKFAVVNTLKCGVNPVALCALFNRYNILMAEKSYRVK